jgi:hypothetical protein
MRKKIKKRGEMSWAVILGILALLLLLFNTPVFGKMISLKDNLFVMLGIDKECPYTAKTDKQYTEIMSEYEQKLSKATLSKDEVDNLKKQCSDFKKCFPPSYKKYEDLCGRQVKITETSLKNEPKISTNVYEGIDNVPAFLFDNRVNQVLQPNFLKECKLLKKIEQLGKPVIYIFETPLEVRDRTFLGVSIMLDSQYFYLSFKDDEVIVLPAEKTREGDFYATIGSEWQHLASGGGLGDPVYKKDDDIIKKITKTSLPQDVYTGIGSVPAYRFNKILEPGDLARCSLIRKIEETNKPTIYIFEVPADVREKKHGVVSSQYFFLSFQDDKVIVRPAEQRDGEFYHEVNSEWQHLDSGSLPWSPVYTRQDDTVKKVIAQG